MGRPKSFVSQLTVDFAKASHNCRFNKDHRIAKGQKRLTAKDGRDVFRYCPACAAHFIRLDIKTLELTVLELESGSGEAARTPET